MKRLPRDVKIAIILLLALFFLAAANTAIAEMSLNALIKDVSELSYGESYDISEEAKQVEADFRRLSFFLSITVNHDDIGEAECELCELVCAVKEEDGAAIEAAKSRFLCYLNKLKRLSGFGIDSII